MAQTAIFDELNLLRTKTIESIRALSETPKKGDFPLYLEDIEVLEEMSNSAQKTTASGGSVAGASASAFPKVTDTEGGATNEFNKTNKRKPIDRQEAVDIVQEALILSYVYGNDAVKDMLGERFVPTTDKQTVSGMQTALYKKVAGETFEDRVKKYADEGDTESIVRVADTEITRVFSTSEMESAKRSGATSKTWVTMKDDRVRDTHFYLEGETIPIDAEFYTYDGDSAQHPCGFTMVSNNANCRCALSFD